MNEKEREWYDAEPSSTDRDRYTAAMVEYFAEHSIGSKSRNAIQDAVSGVIDILAKEEPIWDKTGRRDLTMQKKRYSTLHQMVIDTKERPTAIKKKIDQLVNEKQAVEAVKEAEKRARAKQAVLDMHEATRTSRGLLPHGGEKVQTTQIKTTGTDTCAEEVE